ncbi:2-amino-4-hydroxy-6-hydroxymethyldihydropteridine diphosphokinase [Teredinibacter sp. KSP-S5-2]|uniref:2-amino-4-hydroxy-6- hydroxymethyldihydropteridine diphosphokinase n=1 Tax=Teredinibacter sp. KSP-S5-2 TaxID=3034506 RepID=UPI0029350E72|nr:2-amino-4-hydroxy-6-hydroxymethyldihydropteridine diphosphokinase [Teredinibacter sp. KSP-S5-2]WNO08612.1 2-amino-4-hydroxy-6-hydroxymethyldihydropteridine diphosphokinase [Teredinibacter sp. KSP-S5-2]
MARVYLSLGSNINKEDNIKSGVVALKKEFGLVALSSVYESEAVGFDGDNFHNLVAMIDTDMDIKSLSQYLRSLEQAHGRDRNAPKFSARTLDIDILTYDSLIGVHSGVELPRSEILKNAFVLWPLAEIAPNECHPVQGKTYASLWTSFHLNGQKIWKAESDRLM